MTTKLNYPILCSCGCGRARMLYDDSGRKRRFITGHNITLPRKECLENPDGSWSVPLQLGMFAIVDRDDFPAVNRFKWTARKHGHIWYAGAQINGKRVRLHQFLMGSLKGFTVDHQDRDGLNNRRSNIRFATKSQQSANQKVRNGRQFKGVQWSPPDGNKRGTWKAIITVNGKKHSMNAKNPEDAAVKFNEMAKRYFGEYASLNKPVAIQSMATRAR